MARDFVVGMRGPEMAWLLLVVLGSLLALLARRNYVPTWAALCTIRHTDPALMPKSSPIPDLAGHFVPEVVCLMDSGSLVSRPAAETHRTPGRPVHPLSDSRPGLIAPHPAIEAP
jgi:hypothetical protein